MQVSVQYTTQLRTALNLNQETFELPADSTVRVLLDQLAAAHQNTFAEFVIENDGLRPNIIITVGDQQVIDIETHPLQPGDVVTILSAISGG